jgi:hypothetical protein
MCVLLYLLFYVGIVVLVLCVLLYLLFYVGVVVLVVLCGYCYTCTMCVLLYLLYYVCTVGVTLGAELLARSQ